MNFQSSGCLILILEKTRLLFVTQSYFVQTLFQHIVVPNSFTSKLRQLHHAVRIAFYSLILIAYEHRIFFHVPQAGSAAFDAGRCRSHCPGRCTLTRPRNGPGSSLINTMFIICHLPHTSHKEGSFEAM